MENLLVFFTYKGIHEVNSDVLILTDVSLNDNVIFEYIFSIENKFFDKFRNSVFEGIKITKNIIEIHLGDKLVKELTEWYCPTGNVYPFVYKIKDRDLILTKVIYTPETHLFNNFLKFPYYTVKEIDFDECFCFQNKFCTKEYHGENMRSTHGYEYYHCTQFVLYNCTFFGKVYDKIYICSECSLLKVQNRIYSLYVDAQPDTHTPIDFDKIYNTCKDDSLPPMYKPKTLYQHVFDGCEPGYYSGGGGTCYQLELVGYKMGVGIMCDLSPYYKKGEIISNYLFDYKTSIAILSDGKYDNETELKLYLHLGNLEKEYVKENMSRKELDEGKERMSQKELDRFTEITSRQNILKFANTNSQPLTTQNVLKLANINSQPTLPTEERLTQVEKMCDTLEERLTQVVDKMCDTLEERLTEWLKNVCTKNLAEINNYTFPLINDYVSDSDSELNSDDEALAKATKEILVREGITDPKTFDLFGCI